MTKLNPKLNSNKQSIAQSMLFYIWNSHRLKSMSMGWMKLNSCKFGGLRDDESSWITHVVPEIGSGT